MCNSTQSHACLLFALLLLLSCIHVNYFAESRPLLMLEVSKGRKEDVVMAEAMIGSRPPRCEGRCSSCGHCEAVQVPLAPQDKNRVLHFSKAVNSRFDDNSNYKPMSWKCKCGDIILNP